MRALIQRVTSAKVRVNDAVIGEINAGLLVLLGVGPDDVEEDAKYLVEKILNLRIFTDNAGKLNLSALDLKKELLVVSQFTLFADCSQGRRPYFGGAAPPELGEKLYHYFCQEANRSGIFVAQGSFGSHMMVELCNDGPVTIWLDSKER